MMQYCHFYLNDKRNSRKIEKWNLEWLKTDWMRGSFRIGESLPFVANSGIWSFLTDHSLTVVTTEGNVLYWKVCMKIAPAVRP